MVCVLGPPGAVVVAVEVVVAVVAVAVVAPSCPMLSLPSHAGERASQRRALGVGTTRYRQLRYFGVTHVGL
jgi:hypothetical protein